MQFYGVFWLQLGEFWRKTVENSIGRLNLQVEIQCLEDIGLHLAQMFRWIFIFTESHQFRDLKFFPLSCVLTCKMKTHDSEALQLISVNWPDLYVFIDDRYEEGNGLWVHVVGPAEGK